MCRHVGRLGERRCGDAASSGTELVIDIGTDLGWVRPRLAHAVAGRGQEQRELVLIATKRRMVISQAMVSRRNDGVTGSPSSRLMALTIFTKGTNLPPHSRFLSVDSWLCTLGSVGIRCPAAYRE